VVGLCERGNELPNFIKCGEFVDSLRNGLIFKEGGRI
jgi:hypothetical protein